MLIGQQHRPRIARRRRDRRLHRRIARPVVAHHRHPPPHPHNEIRRQRRDRIVRIDVGEAAHRRRHGGMQMHHRAALRPRRIESAVHEHFLRRLVAADVIEAAVQPRQARGLEVPERGIGRRDQEAIGQAHTDVAGAAHREAAREQRARQLHQQGADVVLAHAAPPSSMVNALRKKSGAPKLPLLSASSSGSPPPSA